MEKAEPGWIQILMTLCCNKVDLGMIALMEKLIMIQTSEERCSNEGTRVPLWEEQQVQS